MTSTSDWTRATSSRQMLVRFRGEVDLDTCPHLRRALACDTPGSDGQVLLDLSGVTFMDCSGLGVLVEAKARLGDRLWLRGVPAEVAELMRITGLLSRFGVIGDAPPPTAAADVVEVAAPEPTTGRLEPLAPDSPSAALELEHRATNGQAKTDARTRTDQARGLLMATYGCDADTAWQMLFRSSRDLGLEVHVLTDSLIEAARGRRGEQSGLEMMAALDAVMTPDARALELAAEDAGAEAAGRPDAAAEVDSTPTG